MDVVEVIPKSWCNLIPVPTRESNKYSRGHVLILGGFPMAGASRLAARAAMRVGAGMVTIAVEPEHLLAYESAMEIAIIRPLKREESLAKIIGKHKVDAVLIGPGAGVSELIRSRVVEALGCGCPTIMDADALTVFSENPNRLFESITGECLLTPHWGEFVRLFGDSKEIDLVSKARQSGATILLKGARTMIASPDGQVFQNQEASAYLASAGTGDVLAGIIIGLLAQGVPMLQSAGVGVLIHSRAAHIIGAGLIARDLPDLIPEAISACSRG